MMRLIKGIWQRNPDLRLGQLVCNVSASKDLYYWEDDVLATALRKFYREGK